MNLNSRAFRMVSALTIVGIAASQIPTRSSVSLAADGYPKSNNNAGTIALAVGGAAVLAKVAPSIVRIGGNSGIQSLKSMTDTIASIPEVSEFNKILVNSGVGKELNESKVDLVIPNNEAIKKEATPDQLALLQSPQGVNEAKNFVMAHTTEYKPNVPVNVSFQEIEKIVFSEDITSSLVTLSGKILIYDGIK